MPLAVQIPFCDVVYVADPTNYVVRAFDSIEGSGQFVLAGNGGKGTEGDGGDPTRAQLTGPYAIAADDTTGDAYIADTFANQVRRVHEQNERLVIDQVTGLGGLSSPFGIARDGARQVTYVADTLANRVLAMRDGGSPTVVAGFASAGGLVRPRGLAVDGSGVLYVADTGHNRVLRLDPASAGTVTSIGTGAAGDSGDGGPATAARLREPAGVALSPDRQVLYIADTGNNRVRSVSLNAGTIHPLAGTGTPGSSDSGTPALQAQLRSPFAVAVLRDGRVVIGDTGNDLVRVVENGVLTTLAGTGTPGFSEVPNTRRGLDELAGPTAVTQGDRLASLRQRACGSPGDGSLLLSLDTFNHSLRAQCSLDSRALFDVVGNGRPGAGSNQLAYPMGLAVGGASPTGDASVYVADTFNDVVRRIDTTAAGSSATTVAGTMQAAGFAGDQGQATSARLSHPGGVAMDAAGNLYIADTYNNRIRRVSTAGTITTIAGTGVSGSEGDGAAATGANLFFPEGVAVDTANPANVYVADTFSHRVRRIDGATGIITTVAGDGQPGFTDGPAASARFDRPWSVSVDDTPGPVGTVVYVADQNGHRVRAVAAGAVTTVAGTGSRGLAGEQGPAAAARVDGPRGVSALAGSGALLVADSFNNRLRVVGAGTLTLTPPVAGPLPVGASQQLTARLVGRSGAPIQGQAVTFTVTGANPRTVGAVTGATGTATLTYSGANAGTDVVAATVTSGSQVLRATSTVLWIAPRTAITTTPVQGSFYQKADSTFTARPGDQAAFSETFPNIQFNPPAGVVSNNASGVGPTTRPFTDVTTDTTGAFTGTIKAHTRDDSRQAGVGDLRRFDAEFTASFVVARAGDVTFDVIVDDGFLLGVGGRATRVSGPYENAPASNRSPFQGYDLVAAWNRPGDAQPRSFPVTVHFPAPGVYPYELDYFSCCHDQLSLSVNVVAFREDTSALSVYVGYADEARTSRTVFPFPWRGSPGVANFVGDDTDDIDSGAIRFDNNSDDPISLDRVTVDVGAARFDIWASRSPIQAAPHTITILTQTQNFDFDTSDTAPTSPVDLRCVPSGVIPQIHVTRGGETTTFDDTEQVLNTRGIDPGFCTGSNESHQWQRVGGGSVSGIDTPLLPTVLLTLSPGTDVFMPVVDGFPTLQVTVSALDGSWQPAANLPVTVTVSGRNARTLSGTTGADGSVQLSYGGSQLGLDLLQATATISGLGTVSNEPSVSWSAVPK